MLERTIYLPAPGPDTAQWCQVNYIDGDLTREEMLNTSAESDTYRGFQRRTSTDNGHHWSELEDLPDVARQLAGGGVVEFRRGKTYDRGGGVLFARSMLRTWPGLPLYTFSWGDHEHPFSDHTFMAENGGEARLLKYEDGPDYDPGQPFADQFTRTNRAYAGTGMAFAEDGAAYFPMVCYRPGAEFSQNRGGVVLMRRRAKSAGEWLPSNQVFIEPERSARGLLEPDVAVLRDGRVMVINRGSHTATTAGRKWVSLSADGGKSLGPIEELRYADGTRFYSPSSIHRFVRSSRNGVLYWVANIVDAPPSGNRPRYPLQIAAIDEERAAVVRESVVVIADRRPDEPEGLALSNFGLLENRETLDLEIYITHQGGTQDHPWHAPVYRYVFSPPV
jgi:hypothetical protein